MYVYLWTWHFHLFDHHVRCFHFHFIDGNQWTLNSQHIDHNNPTRHTGHKSETVIFIKMTTVTMSLSLSYALWRMGAYVYDIYLFSLFLQVSMFLERASFRWKPLPTFSSLWATCTVFEMDRSSWIHCVPFLRCLSASLAPNLKRFFNNLWLLNQSSHIVVLKLFF